MMSTPSPTRLLVGVTLLGLLGGCTDYEALARETLEEDLNDLTVSEGTGEHAFEFSGTRPDGYLCTGTIRITADAVQIGSRSWSSTTDETCRLPDDIPSLRQICAGQPEDTVACGRAARALREDDPEQAMELASVGCPRGDRAACFHGGVLAEAAQQTADAHRFYVRACDHGSVAGCFNAGVMERNGRGTDVDYASAFRRLQPICDGEESLRDRACVVVAEMHFGGQGTPRDHRRALALARPLCSSDNPGPCVVTSAILADGEGVEREPEAAFRYAQIGCDADVAAACGNLAVMHERGLGTERDPAAAQRLRERACQLGHAASCGA